MPIEPSRYREIFGSFPTVVSVVTTVDAHGVPRGLTVNTVCAVSIDPPLLLVAVGGSSNTLPAMRSAGGFVVNLLAGDAAHVSRTFSSPAEDKFAGLRWRRSAVAAGTPVLVDHVLAVAECRTERVLEVGDHWLFVGRVEAGATFPRGPLLHHRGTYREWVVGDAVSGVEEALSTSTPAASSSVGSPHRS